MGKKKKTNSAKRRKLMNNIFSIDPLQMIHQQGMMNGDGYNEEDMMYFQHPILGMAPEMLKQAFVYEQEHQNHDSVAINWHEEKDHFELVITCHGLSKKRAQVSFDQEEHCLVVKCKLKPLSSMMESVTFHRRVPIPESVNITEKPHITDLNVERSEYDGSEGICVIIRKQGAEVKRIQEETNSMDNLETMNKKPKQKKAKPKKKVLDDDYVIDAQFIEKCA